MHFVGSEHSFGQQHVKREWYIAAVFVLVHNVLVEAG